MDFKDFEIEDFFQNEFFVDWVLHQHPEADHFWASWLSRHPEKVAQVEMAKELVKSMSYQQQFRMEDNEYTELMESILQHDKPRSLGRRVGRFLVKNTFRIAASVIIGLGVVFYLTQTAPDPQPKQLASEWKVVSTEFGQKKIVQLPDGTKVIMNSGSSIRYPMPFIGDYRMVKFSGEGFFDVAHNPEKPFYIESKSFTTCVLGTSFNLRCFDDEEQSSVSVASGKVKVKTDAGDYAVLMPSEVGVYNRKTRQINQDRFDKDKILAWTEGVLLFENESLPKIFKRLERWYGVKIEVGSDVSLTGKYSGEYRRKSLELVLEGLSYTSNINYEINNQTIHIYEKKESQMTN